MRIVCSKCSAAYAIDDKFVTAKGVRAQCPRCRNLQLVKKDDAAAAPSAPPAVAPVGASAPGFLFDVGKGGPPPPPSMSGAKSGTELDFADLPPPPGKAPPAASPAPAPFAFDFSAAPPPPNAGPRSSGSGLTAAPSAMPFDFGAPPPPASDSPFSFGGLAPPPPPPASEPTPGFSSSPSRAPSFPGSSPSSGSNARASPFDLDGLVSNAESPAITSDVKCKSCGKALTDAFDQALGTCDDCRSKQQGSELDGPSPDSNAGRVEHIDTGAILARMSPPGQRPLAQVPPPVAAPGTPANPVSPAEASVVRSAMRQRESEGRGKSVAIGLLLVLVLGGVGAFAFFKKPWEKKRPALVVKPTAPQSAKAIDAVVQGWRLNYPELDGASSRQAEGFLAQGEEHLALDTTPGYRDAEEEFQKALVLDASNDRAVAGWVLAVAFGRAGQIDDQTAHAAESMLSAAEQRSGDPHVYVAHAHFFLARGVNVNDIKAMAERGQNSSNARDKALASLAIGQAMLGKNDAAATQAFADALKLDPKLKRGYLFQAKLAASVGRYKDAIDNLEKRLSLDPDQWEAADDLSRLYVEVGEVPKAHKVLEAAKAAAPRNARPKISLAMLAYQHEGNVSAAIDQLTAFVQDKEVSKKDLADALAHLGAAHRVAGDYGKAGDDVDKALELVPDHVPAKLQHFLVMLEKGVNSEARIDLDSLKGKLGDEQLENVLEGRLLLALGRFDDAAALLSRVQETQPRRVDALLLAGAAAAKAKHDGKAWEYCLKRGLKADPLSTPLPAMTPLFVRSYDVLKPAIGAYAALNPSGEEDPNPALCEGLVAWFADDLTSSDRHFARVNAIDPKNADGFAFRAFIALRKRDIGSAVKFSGRAVDSGRVHALALYSQAWTLQATNKLEPAKVTAMSSSKFGAALLAPKVMIADIEAKQKNPDEARRLLSSVLLTDSAYREAKRVLYKNSL